MQLLILALWPDQIDRVEFVKMTSDVLVTIIMPARNAEKYIGEAILSVINQDYRYWELIIINDGSVDRTGSIIQMYSDSRIRYFFQENKGVSSARNVGIANMKGKYLCCLDADDSWPPNSLSSRLKIFDEDREAKFVDGRVHIYDSTLRHFLGEWKPSFTGMPFHMLVRLAGKCFFGPTWMIKIDSNFPYFYDEDFFYAEDLLFYISIAHLGKYTFTNDCVLHYRKNEISAMTNLEGLAGGYAQLYTKISNESLKGVDAIDRIFFFTRSRKFMFLAFWNKKEYSKAIRYLAAGHL